MCVRTCVPEVVPESGPPETHESLLARPPGPPGQRSGFGASLPPSALLLGLCLCLAGCPGLLTPACSVLPSPPPASRRLLRSPSLPPTRPPRGCLSRAPRAPAPGPAGRCVWRVVPRGEGGVGAATGRGVHLASQSQGRGPARAQSSRPHPGLARGGAARAAAWRRSSLVRVGGAPPPPPGPLAPPPWDGGGLTYPSPPLPRPRGRPGPGGVAWGRGRGTAAAWREEAGGRAGASPPARGALERACGAGPAAPPPGPHCSAAGGGWGGGCSRGAAEL